MPNRARMIIVTVALASICAGVCQPLQAAPVPGGKLLELRMARLKKYAHSVPASTSSSSSMKASAWEMLRLNKRRGGGGHAQEVASASSSQAPENPVITFAGIIKNYGDTTFALSPVSNSNGTFTFTSSNPSVATIAGNTVTIVAAGTTTITATQAATDGFTSAVSTATLTVNTIAPTIIPLISISKTTLDFPFVLSDPVSNSAGAFTFTSTNPSVAIISGRTVTIVAPGITTIISTQAANGNYKRGSGSTILTVMPGLEDS